MSLIALAHAPAHGPPPLTPAAMAFYATVATFIPVLYVALAVQGNASQSIFGAARAVMKPIIRSLIRNFFRHVATERPQKKTEIIRQRTVIIRQIIFITAAAWTIPLAAVLIIIAGALGETLAVYALYQGQDTLFTRTIVLVTAIFLISAVAAGPAVTFVKTASTFIRQIIKDVFREVMVGGVVKEVILGSITKKLLRALEKDDQDLSAEAPGTSQGEAARPETGQTDPAQSQKDAIFGGITKKYQATAEKFLRALEKADQDLSPEAPGTSQGEAARLETGQTDPAQN